MRAGDSGLSLVRSSGLRKTPRLDKMSRSERVLDVRPAVVAAVKARRAKSPGLRRVMKNALSQMNRQRRRAKLNRAPSKLEGPFTYRSGWRGRYDPREGRYLGLDDIYMPRDFDPHTGMVFGKKSGRAR